MPVEELYFNFDIILHQQPNSSGRRVYRYMIQYNITLHYLYCDFRAIIRRRFSQTIHIANTLIIQRPRCNNRPGILMDKINLITIYSAHRRTTLTIGDLPSATLGPHGLSSIQSAGTVPSIKPFNNL